MELHSMKFDEDEKSFLKKWNSKDTDTHRIDYENVLKLMLTCTVKLVVRNIDLL